MSNRLKTAETAKASQNRPDSLDSLTTPRASSSARRQATRYVNAIRNKGKRSYANDFLKFLTAGTPNPDECIMAVYNCGFMARQSVRLNLTEILGL